MSLFIHFVRNGNEKADRNGVRLPECLDHPSAFIFL